MKTSKLIPLNLGNIVSPSSTLSAWNYPINEEIENDPSKISIEEIRDFLEEIEKRFPSKKWN